MERTELLTFLRDTFPRMVKVIVTGYLVLENALEAINRGVEGYSTKPVNSETLLRTVKEHLGKQQKNRHFTEESLREYMEARFKQASAMRLGIYPEKPCRDVRRIEAQELIIIGSSIP
jgi:YesN/AraC family two-component response regulator